MDHGAREHAKFGGSSASRWLRCAAAQSRAATMPPRPSSPEAIDGTKAHELLDYCIQHGFDTPDVWMPYGDDPAKRDAVQMVLDYIAGLREQHDDLQVMHEQRFVFPQDVVPPGDCSGYADILAYSPSTTYAWCIDFKFGAGVVVEAERNEQALFYATGALWSLPVSSVHCVIIQPRAWHKDGPVRVWRTDAHALLDFSARVDDALRAAQSPTAAAVPGKHCRWCPAEFVCAEREQQALSVAVNGFANVRDIDQIVLPEPTSIDLQRISRILAGKEALREWLKAIESFATDTMRSGGHVPGYKLVEAQPRRDFVGEPAEAAAKLAEISGLAAEVFMPPTLIGVGEAEKLVVKAFRDSAKRGQKDKAAAEAKEKMAFVTLRKSSGNLTLVPESDPRPSAISKAFGGVNLLPPPA